MSMRKNDGQHEVRQFYAKKNIYNGIFMLHVLLSPFTITEPGRKD
jgi:hypothetical protein